MPDILLKRWAATVLEEGVPFSVLCIWAPDKAEAMAKVREHFPSAGVTVDPYLVNGRQPTQSWPYGYRRRLAKRTRPR
jgi:predicted O-linked N-acetylglucosamine transferase (SPINDLY family)